MKKTLIIIFLCSVFAVRSFSQQSKPYVTSGLEMIFSLANIDDNGSNPNSTLRWAPVINIQSMLNKDLSKKFGVFTGLAVRNVGYIYDHYYDPAEEVYYKKKFRSYNLGVPVGIKIGNLNGAFLYGGYEIELPFLYKEKTFDAGGKIAKTTGFFSSRENLFQHGFLVGIEFPYGINLKFKYYLSEFHNQDFQQDTPNGVVYPYKGLESHIFYFSLSSYLFKNFHFESQAYANEW
jgi:hypothetical protein